MKSTIINTLAFATLSLTLGIAGCAADATVESTEAASVDLTTEHELSVIPSNTHPAVSDGRTVEEWHTFLTRGGSFRVRGVTTGGETIAEFVFRPDAAGTSLVVESIAPERGVLRIVNGEITERFKVSAPTQALYEGMGTDLEALQGVGEKGANGVSPQGWWACTKATAKVTYHCGGSAVKIIACLRRADSASDLRACVIDVGQSCKDAAKKWVAECL